MKLFFCVFGLLALASANPGNLYVGECISCTDIRTNYSNIPESANSTAGQLARKIADNLAKDLNRNFGGQIPGPVIYKPKQTSNGATPMGRPLPQQFNEWLDEVMAETRETLREVALGRWKNYNIVAHQQF
ncbi:hypothetical protein ACLKA7_009223 [Drosophila subpalustris]